jgi:DNA-directed RNA polymerase alpha subunit
MTKLREPVNINSLKYGLLYRDKALNRSTDTEQRNKNREILDSICFGEFILTDELESVPIEDMDFSVRAYNILKRGGCSTALDIYKVGTSSEKSLYSLRNMGSKVFKEIYTKMMLRFNIDCTQKQG